MSEAPGGRQVEAFNLDRFRARSDAFLFAARRDAPDRLVYLEQGTAVKRRDFAREHLMCPELGCTAPEITTVSRARGGWRDGYRHRVLPAEGAHAPESVLHREGKALVARWATTQPGVSQVEVEAGLGDRIADVLLTSERVNKMAIEVQYSGISVEEWIERTESYKRMGIPVVWLFGHRGPHSPLDRRHRQVHKQVLGREWPLLWINPTEERIAWLENRHQLRLVGPEAAFNGIVRFGTLDDLTLRKSGIYPHGFLSAREGTRLEREAEARRAEEAAALRDAQAADRIARRRLGRTYGSAPSPGPSTDPWERLRERHSPRRLELMAKFRPEMLPQPAAPKPRKERKAQAPLKPRCRRCGRAVDPALKSGVHVDAYCDRA